MIRSKSGKLIVSLHGHTALIEMNNPPANTWDTESLAALRDLIGDLTAERDVYALVLTGSGEKFFSAGADLKLFADGLEAERDLFLELFATQDQREGVSAFLEKREPQWKNA